MGGVHPCHVALVFALVVLRLAGFIERLLCNHDSLADFGGEEVVGLGRSGLCHDLLVDRLCVPDEIWLRA